MNSATYCSVRRIARKCSYTQRSTVGRNITYRRLNRGEDLDNPRQGEDLERLDSGTLNKAWPKKAKTFAFLEQIFVPAPNSTPAYKARICNIAKFQSKSSSRIVHRRMACIALHSTVCEDYLTHPEDAARQRRCAGQNNESRYIEAESKRQKGPLSLCKSFSRQHLSSIATWARASAN